MTATRFLSVHVTLLTGALTSACSVSISTPSPDAGVDGAVSTAGASSGVAGAGAGSPSSSAGGSTGAAAAPDAGAVPIEARDAGGGGTAGGAQTEIPEPPECEDHDDCADASYCNGAERCDEGRCRPGTPVVCENPSPGHCETICLDSIEACLVEALDNDADGFLDAQCPIDDECTGAGAEPSCMDDCDDRNEDVHPGTDESCNGVDDDCNGSIDDGLALGGGVTPIADWPYADIDWSPVGGLYGIVTTTATTAQEQSGVYYGVVPKNGVPETYPTSVVDLALSGNYLDANLAWGQAGAFMVSYEHQIDAIGSSYAVVLSVSGTPDDPDSHHGIGVYLGQRVAAFGDGWLAATGDGTQSRITNLTRDQAPVSALLLDEEIAIVRPHIAASGDQAAIVWAGESGLRWSRVALTVGNVSDAGMLPMPFAITVPESLPGGIASPDIAATPDGDANPGYVIASSRAGSFAITRVTRDGGTVCESGDVSFGNQVGGLDYALGVTFTTRGIFVIATDASADAVSLFRFDGSCEQLESRELNTDAGQNVAVLPRRPAISAGDDTLGLVWTEGDGDGEAQVRIVHELLCK